MFTSSTNITIRLPGGGPRSVFFLLSSFDSIDSCVRRAEVCAEKEMGSEAHAPPSTSRLMRLDITADLPTPEWPVKSIGLETESDFSSR